MPNEIVADFLFHHSDIIEQLDFYPLSVRKEKILREFNRHYEAWLDRCVNDKQKQWPAYLAADGDAFKHYRRLLQEGSNYEAAQLKRIHDTYPSFRPNALLFSDYRQPSRHRLEPHLSLAVPASLTKLNDVALIFLALSAQGENLYHFLTRTINEAVFVQAEAGGLPCQTHGDLIDFLNGCDSSYFDEHFQQTTLALPPLYVSHIVPLMATLKQDLSQLAYCDSKPVELIGSACIYNYQAQDAHLSAQQKQALILLAAQHGHFPAANRLRGEIVQRIAGSGSCLEAWQHYEQAQQTLLPMLTRQYKTVGQLFVVDILNTLHMFFINAASTVPQAVVSAIKDKLVIDTFHAVLIAQQQEYTHHSRLRLCYGHHDDYVQYISSLFKVKSPQDPVESLAEALSYIKKRAPHLRDQLDTMQKDFRQNTPRVSQISSLRGR